MTPNISRLFIYKPNNDEKKVSIICDQILSVMKISDVNIFNISHVENVIYVT